jgi:hypothetical protein
VYENIGGSNWIRVFSGLDEEEFIGDNIGHLL